MKSSIEVSVIVPIHNVDDFLDNCLASLSNQKIRSKYEVICILDNASKKCEEIAKKYQQEFPEIFVVVISQNNDVSSTRNDGLKIARGNYITFVDGDDFVNENFLNDFLDETLKENADIVCCNYNVFKNNKSYKTLQNLIHVPPKSFKKEKACMLLLRDFSMRGYVWNKFFKREIIEKIHFINSKYVIEDITFCYMAFSNAKKITYINKFNYYYRSRNDSLVKTLITTNSCQYLLNTLALLKFYSYSINKPELFKLPIILKKLFILIELSKGKYNKNTKEKLITNANKQLHIINKYLVFKNTPWEEVIKKEQLNIVPENLTTSIDDLRSI